MKSLSISEVARKMGIRASAIRYYEQIGLLRPPQRIGGKRRYGEQILPLLAVIQRARQTGFTLDEIRHLFFGFHPKIRPSVRWRQMADQKLVELEVLRKRIETMQELLRRMDNCRCEGLEECGEKILQRRKMNESSSA